MPATVNGGMAICTGFLSNNNGSLAHIRQYIVGGERDHQNLTCLELLGGFLGIAANANFALKDGMKISMDCARGVVKAMSE